MRPSGSGRSDAASGLETPARWYDTSKQRETIERGEWLDDWRKGTDVHFYKEEERELLGDAVASAIKWAITKRRVTPNE